MSVFHRHCTALDPLSVKLRSVHTNSRLELLRAWHELIPDAKYPLPERVTANAPLIASAALERVLQLRLNELQVLLSQKSVAEGEQALAHLAWPLGTDESVLTADLAVVADDNSPDGWSLRWVEFQAFTSVVATAYTAWRAARLLWPELREYAPTAPHPTAAIADPDCYLSALKEWMARGDRPVLLESNPWEQATRFDFEAAAHWFGVAVLDLRSVLSRADAFGAALRPSQVLNRVILHELGSEGAVLEAHRTLSRWDVTWHSHPAGYYRINKGLLPSLGLNPAERCTLVCDWRALDRPASDLVLKAVHSFGGKDVHMAPTAAVLDDLAEGPQRTGWVVQPRHSPAPLFTATDGTPRFGEIRCVLQRRADGSLWQAARFVRLNSRPFASASAMTGATDEGLALLLGLPRGAP